MKTMVGQPDAQMRRSKMRNRKRCRFKSLNHPHHTVALPGLGYGPVCTSKQESAANQQERMMRSVNLFTGMITLTAILAIPAMAVAQETSGRYATHDGTSTLQEMPDGSKVQIDHYSQISFAADQRHPLDNMSADCMGRSHISTDGALLSGSGTCTGFDGDGNTASFWWRIDKIDTPDCAGTCGVWGYYAGTGKFQGIEGSGTFHTDTMFPNGSSGTWKGKATVN
jgi:hypothetical protein